MSSRAVPFVIATLLGATGATLCCVAVPHHRPAFGFIAAVWWAGLITIITVDRRRNR